MYMETICKNLYEAPSTKVRELQFEELICQSVCVGESGLQDYEWNDVEEE